MLIYFLKTILLLGIFYALYVVFLKNKKSFRWNRIYLLLTAPMVVLLPAFRDLNFLHDPVLIAANEPLHVSLQTLNVYAKNIQQGEISFAKTLLAVYLLGVLWGMLRITLGLIVLRRIRQGALLQNLDGQDVCLSAQIDTPFSFGNKIYIPYAMRDMAELPVVIAHEKAHMQMAHSRDKIYFSVMQAVLWFNPFMYLYHRELELLHEFEADASMVEQSDPDPYVNKLIKAIHYKPTPTLLVHHFFHHPIKTRITMLYKTPQNPGFLKALVSSLTVLVCMLTLWFQSNAQHIDQNPIIHANSTEYQDEVMPQFPGGDDALMQFIMNNLIYPTAEANAGLQGKVTVNFVIDEEGNITDVVAKKYPEGGENLAKEAVRVIKIMPKWTPGKQKGKNVKVSYSLPVSFRLS